jgi:hypothetical protein
MSYEDARSVYLGDAYGEREHIAFTCSETRPGSPKNHHHTQPSPTSRTEWTQLVASASLLNEVHCRSSAVVVVKKWVRDPRFPVLTCCK